MPRANSVESSGSITTEGTGSDLGRDTKPGQGDRRVREMARSRNEPLAGAAIISGQTDKSDSQTKHYRRKKQPRTPNPLVQSSEYASPTKTDKRLQAASLNTPVTIKWEMTTVDTMTVYAVPPNISHDRAEEDNKYYRRCYMCNSKAVRTSGWTRVEPAKYNDLFTAVRVSRAHTTCYKHTCLNEREYLLVTLPPPKATFWTKDLTTEGIEPNPGPSSFVQTRTTSYASYNLTTTPIANTITATALPYAYNITFGMFGATAGSSVTITFTSGPILGSFRLLANNGIPNYTINTIGPHEAINFTAVISTGTGTLTINRQSYQTVPDAIAIVSSVYAAAPVITSEPSDVSDRVEDLTICGDIESNPGPETPNGYNIYHLQGGTAQPTIALRSENFTFPNIATSIYLVELTHQTNPPSSTVAVAAGFADNSGTSLTGTLQVVANQKPLTTILYTNQFRLDFLLQSLQGPGTQAAFSWNVWRLVPDNTLSAPRVSFNTTGPLPVSITGTPIDTFITNTSIPVEIDTGDVGLPVAIAEASLPLWTSNFGPAQSTGLEPIPETTVVADDNYAKERLALSGDVETNPGPAGMSLPPYKMCIGQAGELYQNSLQEQVQDRHEWSATRARLRTINDQLQKKTYTAGNITKYLLVKAGVETNPGPDIPGKPPGPEEFVEPEIVEIPPASFKFNTLKPNPDDYWTMDRLTDHITAKAKLRGRTGDVFRSVASIWTVETSNYYQQLADVIEGDPECQPLVTTKPRRPQTQPQTQTTERSEGKARAKVPDQPHPQPRPAIANITAVLNRIADKIRSDMNSLGPWLRKPGSPKFKNSVVDLLFGVGWRELEEFHQYHFIAYCLLDTPAEIATKLAAASILRYDVRFIDYCHLFDNFRADLEVAKLHNKLMHAFNGNILSKSMKDVDDAPTWKSLCNNNNAHLQQFTGLEAQIGITNVDGMQATNQSNLFYADRFRATNVQADNSITRNTIVPMPSTNLIPRTGPSWYNDGRWSGYIPIYGGLSVTEVNVAEYYNYPITPSNLSTTLSNQIKENQTQVWRRDNTSMPGFSTFDVASINTTLISKGLSLEQMLLKLDMLHSILSVGGTSTKIPRSVWSALCPNLTATETNAVIGINNSTNAGEQSGGLTTPTFPFFGGTGSVSFHLTLSSVPIESRNTAIICPPGLLQSSEDAQVALSLFTMSWAEWPFGVYTYRKEATAWYFEALSGETGPIEDITYIPTQTLTRVPGERDLHIVLPRRYAEQNPQTQNAANAQTMIQPRSGPQATNAMPANSNLNVSYVAALNAGVQTYQLTDYLVSWATAISPVTIKQYLGRLGVMVGIKDTLPSVHEMNIALCQVYPQMALNDLNPTRQSNDWFPGNEESEGGQEQQMLPLSLQTAYCNHTLTTQLNVGETVEHVTPAFPVMGTTPADYRIFETNIGVWNKVVTGLAEAANITSELVTSLPTYVGNPMSHMWERIESIPMAAGWAAYYKIIGLTTKAWDDGYDTAENTWIQTTVRHTFCTTHQTGTVLPARYGGIVRNLITNIFERAPCQIESSVGSTTVKLSHTERWLPGSTFAKTFSWEFISGRDNRAITFYDGLTPTILPDIWLQYLARKIPKSMMSFPPPMGEDSTQGYNENLFVHRNNSSNVVGPYIENGVPATYMIDQGPDISDEIKWNTRLWYVSPDRTIANYAAQPLPVTVFPPANRFPVAKYIQLADGESYPPALLMAATYSFPEMDHKGNRIIPYLTPEQSTNYILALLRARRIDHPAWLVQSVFRNNPVQALGGKGLHGAFEDIASQGTPDFSSQPVGETVLATTNMIAQQAIDASSLPSANDPPIEVQTPAPTASTI